VLLLATGNPGKRRELRAVLSPLPVTLESLKDHPEVAEPPEEGSTFADNARGKALYYARATGRWCLADDSGLEVDALDGAPGVRSARYASDHCPPHADRSAIDQANNRKLLAEMTGVPDDRRTARFVCHLALADPRGILAEACDTVEGRILRQGRGHNGFGYDPLFYIVSEGCTAAELSAERKNRISHRGKATTRLVAMLREAMGQRNQGPGIRD
jgi:XTP/dITP diphosphohydrolase